jgi:hypothetical protein
MPTSLDMHRDSLSMFETTEEKFHEFGTKIVHSCYQVTHNERTII